MAEFVVSSLAKGMISDLGSEAVKALLQKVKLLWSVEDEVRRLKDTVSTINSVLVDAEDKQAANRQIKLWLRRLKDVMYDADDVLDDFFTEVLQWKVMFGSNLKAHVQIFFSRNNQFVYGLKMGHKLKVIRQRLDDVAKDKAQFHLSEGKSQAETKKGDPSHSSKPKIFIGREKEQHDVIRLLLQPDSKKKVSKIALIGHGGMGKTTLTRQVFNDDNVTRSFDLKVWVCVSQNLEVKLVVKMILESFTKKAVGEAEMDTLVSKLKSEIVGKKYLLVLDDVWDDSRQRWCDLEDLLDCGAQGSKILVTTRMLSVAKAIGATYQVYLEALSKEDSWSLFQQIAFQEKEELRNQSLLDIGKRIADKCLGVPLVIRTIGCLLYHEDSESEWLKFEELEISKIDHEAGDKVMSTLLLSYNRLPSDLKCCFAYCSLFPKDYWIDVETLVKLWMAQGLLKSSDTVLRLTDVGFKHFRRLLHGGFFQEEQTNDWGKIEKCKMHDLMHDLATKVAEEECKILDLDGNVIKERTRHVSADSTLVSRVISEELPSCLAEAIYLRTFFLHSKVLLRLDEDVFNKISSAFKCTRVLDLHGTKIKSVPKSIGSLKHLRYLDLSHNEFRFLPNSLTRLVNLQTLKLNHCSYLERLPRDINRLVKLRHLEMEGYSSLAYMPSGLGQLSSLEELSLFVICNDNKSKYCSRLSELRDLNNLIGKLIIGELRHGHQDKLDFEAANLKEKKGLELLELTWAHVASEKIEKSYDEEMLDCLQLSNLKRVAYNRLCKCCISRVDDEGYGIWP